MSVKMTSHPIRDFRKEKGLSLKELSEDIGISYTTLHNLEYNRGQYTARMVISYCLRKGISPTVFFPCDETPVRLRKVS